MDFIHIAPAPPWLRQTLLGLALSLGASLPADAGPTEPELQAPALVAPGLGCGATPATAALFSQVAWPVAQPVARQQPSRQAARRQAQAAPRSHGPRQATPRPQHRRHAEVPPPRPAEPAEAQPSLSHAYFTCSTTPLVAIPVGAGWLAVGPMRRS